MDEVILALSHHLGAWTATESQSPLRWGRRLSQTGELALLAVLRKADTARIARYTSCHEYESRDF